MRRSGWAEFLRRAWEFNVRPVARGLDSLGAPKDVAMDTRGRRFGAGGCPLGARANARSNSQRGGAVTRPRSHGVTKGHEEHRPQSHRDHRGRTENDERRKEQLNAEKTDEGSTDCADLRRFSPPPRPWGARGRRGGKDGRTCDAGILMWGGEGRIYWGNSD